MLTPSMYIPHSITALVLVLACFGSPPSHAQVPELLTHPELYVEVQDNVFIRKVDMSGRPIQPDAIISAAYRFEMVYDSSSRVQYLFSECRHNGVRPRLLAWKDGHIHSARDEMMADSSRTASFPIEAGDSISFYREFKWYNPKDQSQTQTNYVALDTLDYVVELVSSRTGLRLALLDSFGVMPRPTPGAPEFHGDRPIMASIDHVIPSTVTRDTGFIRVRMYARGDGPYLPIRKDDITIGSSWNLLHGYWDYYLDQFGGSLGKRTVTELTRGVTDHADVTLSVVDIGKGVVRIDFSSPSDGGPLRVGIFDAAGNEVFTPYGTTLPDGAGRSATYAFSSSGRYFVALIQGNSIIASRNVTITL